MKIFPTNNSISYKILKKINNKLFNKEPPSNVCAYFWLSVFYGAMGVFLLLNLVVCVEVLLGAVSNYQPWVVSCYHPIFVVWGILMVSLLFIMFLGVLSVATIVILFSTVLYIFNHKNISTSSFYEFQSDMRELFANLDENTIKIFKVLLNKVKSIPPFNKIKCPKLNFDEEK